MQYNDMTEKQRHEFLASLVESIQEPLDKCGAAVVIVVAGLDKLKVTGMTTCANVDNRSAKVLLKEAVRGFPS